MFALRIAVTLSAVESTKAELTRSLPDIKSSRGAWAWARLSHLCGAACGFAIVQTGHCRCDGSALFELPQEHGFEADSAHLYRAAAQIAILGVLDALPKLHVNGIGFGGPWRNADGSRQSPRQRYAEFLERRENCLGRRATEAFLRSLALLVRIPRTKTIRSGTGSYRLKHIAENYVCAYPEGGTLGPNYVPNGMLIAAAVHTGFRYKTDIDDLGYDTLNATFNMSKTVIDDLDAEIRPDLWIG
jgi:hypothetical protein